VGESAAFDSHGTPQGRVSSVVIVMTLIFPLCLCHTGVDGQANQIIPRRSVMCDAADSFRELLGRVRTALADLLGELFELECKFGTFIPFVFLERHPLLSWKQVAMKVRQASGESLTLQDLRHMGARGWIPILPHPHGSEVGIGFPRYVPSRIHLLLELERDGYTADELQTVAKWQEDTITHLLGPEPPSINNGAPLDKKGLSVQIEMQGRVEIMDCFERLMPYEGHRQGFWSKTHGCAVQGCCRTLPPLSG
jgi:hypothetical protein